MSDQTKPVHIRVVVEEHLKKVKAMREAQLRQEQLCTELFTGYMTPAQLSQVEPSGSLITQEVVFS